MNERKFDYKSPLREYFYAYLDFKASTDQEVRCYAYLFKRVDDFLTEKGYTKTYIDRDIYKAWLDGRVDEVSPATVARDSSMMRGFLIFTTKMGNECYIPHPRKQPARTYIPHVFSQEELDALFKAIDMLRLENRCTRNSLHMMPALFRLLYSTGMRLGEALELRNRDVDMGRHVIKIRKTKNWHERLAPINESLGIVLEEYLRNRRRLPTSGLDKPDGYFLCNAKGQKCTQGTINRWFHIARKDAGIPYYGKSSGPNVHCLRHTACVHSLKKMVESGKDPYCCLPTLSFFMGHRDVKDTEYYLHLCESLYPDIIHLDRSISSGINSVIKDFVKRQVHGDS